MRTLSWHKAVLTIVVALFLVSTPSARAQEKTPDDATPSVPPRVELDPDLKDNGVEQDDPTARLDWQRGAWGIVSPTFRSLALKEGKKHSDKKNAPGAKWVNIG